MTKLLFIPALLSAAACTEVAAPDDQVPSSSTTSDGDGSASTPVTPDAPDASLRVGFTSEPASCDDNSVFLRGYVFNDSDGTVIENPICVFTLADGRTFDGCFAVPSIPDGELVTFTATDPATGASASYSEVVSGPPTFDATLEVTALDHHLAWNVTTHFGNGTGAGDVRIDIDPIQTVIIPDPQIFNNAFGTVEVTALGAYTVSASASISYGPLTCTKNLTQTVNVFCDGSAHH